MKLVRISHRSDSDESDLYYEIACDCGKRTNVVTGLGKDAHSYPQADICSVP